MPDEMRRLKQFEDLIHPLRHHRPVVRMPRPRRGPVGCEQAMMLLHQPPHPACRRPRKRSRAQILR